MGVQRVGRYLIADAKGVRSVRGIHPGECW
jgi:hypothetical protein